MCPTISPKVARVKLVLEFSFEKNYYFQNKRFYTLVIWEEQRIEKGKKYEDWISWWDDATEITVDQDRDFKIQKFLVKVLD